MRPILRQTAASSNKVRGPARDSAAASRNNLHGVPGNGSKLAPFTPEQPRRTKSHGGDHHRCLFRGQIDVLGALLKPWKNLLRPAAAESQAGSSRNKDRKTHRPLKELPHGLGCFGVCAGKTVADALALADDPGDLIIFERPSKTAPSLISMEAALQSPMSLPVG